MMKKEEDKKQRKFCPGRVAALCIISLAACLLPGCGKPSAAIDEAVVSQAAQLMEGTEASEGLQAEGSEAKENPQTAESTAEQSEAVFIAPKEVWEMTPGTVLERSVIDETHLEQYFLSGEIQKDDEIYRRINGKSYRENERIALSDLRYLKLLHYNFSHEPQIGELIVNKAIEKEVREIFQKLYQEEYEIETMYLVDNYWPGEGGAFETVDGNGAGVAADAESMLQNNTSCFNYRTVPGKKSLSNHALGRAIDLNPLQNPYVVFDQNGNQVLEAEGDASYIDRKNRRSHMIDREDAAYRIFTEYGFGWGGNWNSSRDYQHFEKRP